MGWLTDRNAQWVDRIGYGFSAISTLAFMPLYVICGGNAWTERDHGQVKVITPKYKGVLRWDSGPHEGLHAYKHLLYTDLFWRGLLTIDVYEISDESAVLKHGRKVPTISELKEFEREMLQRIIKKEREKL